MDLMTIAAFVAFLALVVVWMAAPTDAKRLSTMVEPSVVGAD
jgi:hypothetical protein